MSHRASDIARQKARGTARFVADLDGTDYLVGALLTARSPHCRVRIDLAGLRSLPGVVAVVDASCAPTAPYSTNPHGGPADTTVFTDVGRYIGDAVGAIACTDRVSLTDALASSPAYIHETPLPAVLSVEQALASDANDTAHHDAVIDGTASFGADDDTIAAALAAAPLTHTSVASFDSSPHGFLERVAASAQRTGGRWLVRSPTQCPSLVRAILCEIFDADVELEPILIGGGFGGKEEVTVEPAAMVLSAAADGRPVLVETTRRQMTAQFRSRHGGRITVTTGFDPDGHFLARLVDVVFEAGPYDGHSAMVTKNAACSAARLYPRGIVAARARAVRTNRSPGGAFRGYGCIQAGFAVETHVDQIARRLAMDPYRIRIINAARDGDVDPVSGLPIHDIRAIECLQQLQAVATGDASCRGNHASLGLALVVSTSAATEADIPDHAQVACRWEPDAGMVVVETAVVEAGQGITNLLTRIACDVLAISEEKLMVELATGAGSPQDPGMFGSRGANVTGSALVQAAEALKHDLIEQASIRMGVAGSAARAEIEPEWEVARCGTASIKLSELGRTRTVGEYRTTDPGLAYGAVRVLAHCDRATGQVEVTQVAAVHDVGVLVDEAGARGQVQGGVLQGIGAALSERATFLSDGSVAETGFVNHLIPTNAALPTTVIQFLPAPHRPKGSTGAKGIGEAAIMGVPAATANAVAAAAEATISWLPLTPERVLRAIDAAQHSSR